jgi:hypothetical protein
LQHPALAVNNNGVIIERPRAPEGAARISGRCKRIGTQVNNGIGRATVIGVDAGTAISPPL